MQEWQGHRSPSIENFLSDRCVLGENLEGELIERLFPAYEQYCKEHDFVPKCWSEVKRFLENEMKLTHRKKRLGCKNAQFSFRGIQLVEGNYG